MSSSYISALVIQKNKEVYLNPETGCIGQTQPIPCPGNGGYLDGDYYAVPVTDSYQFTGFVYQSASAPPTPQSFPVIRLVDTQSSDVWWIRGNTAEYTASCAVCCGNTPVPMPTDLPLFAPCQTLCIPNANNQYQAWLSIPTISPGGYLLQPVGYFNGVALPEPSAPFSTSAALLTFLNTSWATVGTWTLDPTGLILTVTQNPGPGTDVLCAAIYQATTSPSGIIE